MPRGKKKIQWSPGDLFTVPLKDGTRIIGQALDLMMVNIVSVALTTVRLSDEAFPDLRSIARGQVMSALATWRDPLDKGHWPIIGHADLLLQRREWPNEQYRSRNWVGARHHNTALVESFLNAYHGMSAWDAWYDPTFFDKLLFNGVERPANVILSKA